MSSSLSDSPTPTTVWVFRHAESLDNASKTHSGWSYNGLSAVGMGQVEDLKRRLNGWSPPTVISSPLPRATQTAQRLFSRITDLDAGWVEPATPMLDHKPATLVYESYPQLFDDSGWLDPNRPLSELCESHNAMLWRCTNALLRAGSFTASPQVAVVTHGSIIKALLSEALDQEPPSVGNLEFFAFTVKGNTWSLSNLTWPSPQG